MHYHHITKNDMLNGDGLRVVLWVSGCGHHCEGCHNPFTWDPDDGLTFDKQAKEELFEALDKPHISGITFSGGDPLHPANRQDVSVLMNEIKQKYPDKTIWLYTGYKWEDIKHFGMLSRVDVLVDGRFDKNLKDSKLMWKGSSNQRVIDVQKSITCGDIVLHCADYAPAAPDRSIYTKPPACGC